MKAFLKILAVVLSAAVLLPLAGCKDSYQDAIIYYEIPEQPYTLDPQTASTDAELSVTANIFEGLLRKNSSGAIVCGVSENFQVNGLTYTFQIRENTVWSNGEPLTADDFVFAFRRAVSPETRAPFAARLFSIENAEDIYNGKKSADTLGVSAPDSRTLVIRLSRADEQFEETLTTSVAMPCNKAFFTESGGKYGLTTDTVLSCGSYKLTRWNKESFGIRLHKNADYTGTMTAKNSAVYITKSEEKTALERLSENNADIAFLDSSLTDTAEKNGLHTVSFGNICWMMTFDNTLSEELRKTLAMLTGSEIYGADLKSGYTAADSVFPPAVVKNSTAAGITPYNPTAAKELFAKQTAKLPDGKFPTDIKLYYYDNGVIKPIITDIVGHWQNNIGAFINIEAIENAESLLPELEKQTKAIAVFPVRADSPNRAEYLKNFGINNTGASTDDLQTRILKGNHILPIAFQNTTIAYTDALSDVCTTLGNGYIDFSFIVKTE